MGDIIWYAGRSDVTGATIWERLTDGPTLVLQLVFLAGAVLLLLCWRDLLRLARRVQTRDWIWVLASTVAGAALRLAGGVRIPMFTNTRGLGHGFNLLNEVLVSSPLSADAHGNGFHALYGLLLSVLPCSEMSVVVVQYMLSVACIPLIYFAARFIFESRSVARWSAVVLAALPAHAYFATTEIRLVPGVFFMLLSLCALGAASRVQRLAPLVAAALLALLATQFYPLLMPLPLVIGLLAAAAPRMRTLLRTRRFWLVGGLCLLAWSVPAVWLAWIIFTREGAVIGTGFWEVLIEAHTVLNPTFSPEPHLPYNAFLMSTCTPPLFWILALTGIVAISATRSGRRYVSWFAVLAVGAVAVVFTLPGMAPGRLNLARLQQPALVFWVMLTGVGLGFVTDTLLRRELFRAIAGATAIVAAVIIWPGPTGKLHTLQHERRVVQAALPNLKDGCAVVFPPLFEWENLDIPSYLAEQDGRRLRWGALAKPAAPPKLLKDNPCLYYYRTSTCFAVGPDESRITGMRPECQKLESTLELKPAHVEQIPASPDDMQGYTADAIEVGFFRVLGPGS
jgi:hypothetical protein